MAGVGLAVPGYLEAASGRVIYSANLGWRDRPGPGRRRGSTRLSVAKSRGDSAAGRLPWLVPGPVCCGSAGLINHPPTRGASSYRGEHRDGPGWRNLLDDRRVRRIASGKPVSPNGRPLQGNGQRHGQLQRSGHEDIDECHLERVVQTFVGEHPGVVFQTATWAPGSGCSW